MLFRSRARQSLQRKSGSCARSLVKRRARCAIPVSYTHLKIPLELGKRFRTEIEEFDRVLGGGVVPGGVTLAGGEPGIGKSTLFLQVAKKLTAYGNVLYVSGEESPSQIKMRAKRLGVEENIYLMAETEVGLSLIHI